MTDYRFLIHIDSVFDPDIILCPRHVKEAINVKRDLRRDDVDVVVVDVFGPHELGTCAWCTQEQEEAANEGVNQ